MPYLVKGTVARIFSAFDCSNYLSVSDAAPKALEHMPTTYFIGNETQAKQYMRLWKARSILGGQPDMSAETLKYLLGMEPLRKSGEEYEDYNNNLVCMNFAFLNDKERVCAFMILYRKDEPSQWMLGFIKDAQAEPSNREVVLLSGLDLNTYIKRPAHDAVALFGPLLANQFMEDLGATDLQKVLSNLVDGTGVISKNAARLGLLLRAIQVTQDKKVSLKNPIDLSLPELRDLFEENPVLDLITQYNIHKDIQLSFISLNECLLGNKVKFNLCKELADIKLTANEKLNKNLLQMTLVLYEEETLELNRGLLQNHALITKFGGLIWNRELIKLFAFMHGKNYSENLMRCILDMDIYSNALSRLVSMGLTDGVPQLFAIENYSNLSDNKKLAELEFIDKIADEDCKRLCLVFWLKGSFTIDCYKQIIAAAERYPLMASTLVDLDKKGVVLDKVNGLRALALNPQAHLQKSIVHHFFPAADKEYYTGVLEALPPEELEVASKALNTLKASEVEALQRKCDVVVENTKNGKTLRIFLPQIAKIKDVAQRKSLIDILYAGVLGSISMQGDAIKKLDNDDLKAKANSLSERYSCVSHLLALGFADGVAIWAADERSQKAKCFRQIILRVEDQCKIIHERLSADAANQEEMYHKWRTAQAAYRTKLYKLACNILMNSKPGQKEASPEDIAEIMCIGKTILDIVDPPIDSVVYKALIVITNIVITCLTAGAANFYKYWQTGDAWFFTQSKSGQEVRSLGNEIIGSLQSG